MMFPEYRRIY